MDRLAGYGGTLAREERPSLARDSREVDSALRLRYVPTTVSTIRSCTGSAPMKAVSVRELKNNPSAALRAARKDPVMVLKRHEPEAVLVHLRDDSLLSEPGLRQAMATSLFRDGSLSLGLAARFSGLGVAGFIDHVSRLGIPVVAGTAETVRQDIETIEAWRTGSS